MIVKTEEKPVPVPSVSLSAEDRKSYRIFSVDILKGCAIISVILIHTFSKFLLSVIGAPYHIWQAVPIFLLLAAFTGALSYQRLSPTSLLRCYNLAVLFRRWKRILLPFIFIWLLQVFVLIYLMPECQALYPIFTIQLQTGISGILAAFFGGGIGPGNYFIPLILVQILVIPLLYWLAVRFSPESMLVFAFFIDIVLQYTVFLTDIQSIMPGLNYLNYLFLAALGIWLAFRLEKNMSFVPVAGVLSFVYITATYYFGFQFWFIDPSAVFFTEFAYFWTLFIIMYGLLNLPASSSERSLVVLAGLGKASWHIFLVQMTFLAFFNEQLVFFFNTILPFAGPTAFLIAQAGLTITVLIICLVTGYGFYLADDRARNLVGRH